MPRQQRTGGVYIRALLVTILLFAAAAAILSAVVPIGPEAEQIGASGLLNILDIRDSGNVGEDPDGVTGDNELFVVAVPFIFNSTEEEGQQRLDRYYTYIDYFEENLSTKTPFKEASDPASHVEVVSLERGDVTNPPFSDSGEVVREDRPNIQYENVTCGDIHDAARDAVSMAGYLTYADKIVAYVNGTSGGNPVTMQRPTVAGCADDVGGDIAAYERSIFQDEQTSGVALHEMGHAFGLCHNAGVEVGGNCDMTRVPQRPDICTGYNSNTSDGPRSIMNYCMPLDKFSGDAASTEDEYPMLEQIFADMGWLYAD